MFRRKKHEKDETDLLQIHDYEDIETNHASKKRKILQRDYHVGEYSIYVKQVIDEMFGEEKQGSVKELITFF